MYTSIITVTITISIINIITIAIAIINIITITIAIINIIVITIFTILHRAYFVCSEGFRNHNVLVISSRDHPPGQAPGIKKIDQMSGPTMMVKCPPPGPSDQYTKILVAIL